MVHQIGFRRQVEDKNKIRRCGPKKQSDTEKPLSLRCKVKIFYFPPEQIIIIKTSIYSLKAISYWQKCTWMEIYLKSWLGKCRHVLLQPQLQGTLQNTMEANSLQQMLNLWHIKSDLEERWRPTIQLDLSTKKKILQNCGCQCSNQFFSCQLEIVLCLSITKGQLKNNILWQ